MTTRTYKTNLRCGGCVDAIKPLLDAEPGVTAWEADVASPDKTVTVHSDTVTPARINELLHQAGYESLGEVTQPAPPAEELPVTYLPLVLIFVFLLGGTLLLQARTGWNAARAMADFMGLFFVAFAFFKLLDLPGFATTYRGYDLIAARAPIWGYVYPFVELSLGVAYLLAWWPLLVNLVTLVVMSVGAAGVLRTLLDGRRIRCACLGAVFNLPMSWVSLAEDAVMAVMAGVMLAM
jgi:copper chaperone CopZ